MHDMISCAVCGAQFHIITSTHLKHHNLNLTQYKELYPTYPIKSQLAIERKKAAASKANANRKGVPRSQEVRDKISQIKKSQGLTSWNKGIPTSEESKRKSSASKKLAFANGTITHWNLGNVTPDHVKAKISKTASDKFIELHQQKEIEKKHKYNELVTQVNDAIALVRDIKNIPTKISSNTIRILDALYIHQQQAHLFNLSILSIDTESHKISQYYDIHCNTCDYNWTCTSQAFRSYKLDISKGEICPKCFPRQTTASKGELELFEFISSLVPCINGERTILSGKELDVYIPSLSLAFEYNGLYWHNDQLCKPKHLLWKQQFAYNQGVKVIHIFEDEWINKQEICKSRIRHLIGRTSNKIHARQCQIRIISNDEKNIFLNANHIQGSDVSAIRYGAFFKDQLVAVLTMKPTNSIKGGDGNQMELSRFASILNTSIVGIANKMFNQYIKDYNPSTVITYSDKRWNTGGVYKAMGFEYNGESPPCNWYFKNNELIRKHRSVFMKHKLVNMPNYDITKTADEILTMNGYLQIWDCGNWKYIWKNKTIN